LGRRTALEEEAGAEEEAEEAISLLAADEMVDEGASELDSGATTLLATELTSSTIEDATETTTGAELDSSTTEVVEFTAGEGEGAVAEDEKKDDRLTVAIELGVTTLLDDGVTLEEESGT